MCGPLDPPLQLRNPLWKEGGVNHLRVRPRVVRQLHHLLRHPVHEESESLPGDVRCSGRFDTVSGCSEVAPTEVLERLAQLNQHAVGWERHFDYGPVWGVFDVETTVGGSWDLVSLQVKVQRAGEYGDTTVVKVPPTQPILGLAGGGGSREVMQEASLKRGSSLQHLQEVARGMDAIGQGM